MITENDDPSAVPLTRDIPGFTDAFYRAVDKARESRCRKVAHGAALFEEQRDSAGFGTRVIVSGMNNPVGFDCMFDASDPENRCRKLCGERCVHAEQSALLKAGLSAAGASLLHIKLDDDLPTSSRGPSCVDCSKLMVVAGVRWVYLLQAGMWWRYSAMKFHMESLKAKDMQP